MFIIYETTRMSSIFASISRIDLDGRHIHYPYADITRYINKKQKQLWPKKRQVLGSPWKNKDRSFPQRSSAEAECLSVKKTKRRCAIWEGRNQWNQLICCLSVYMNLCPYKHLEATIQQGTKKGWWNWWNLVDPCLQSYAAFPVGSEV